MLTLGRRPALCDCYSRDVRAFTFSTGRPHPVVFHLLSGLIPALVENKPSSNYFFDACIMPGYFHSTIRGPIPVNVAERRGIDYVLLGCDPKEAAAKYEIPTATRAKMFCRVNASRGILTHADILLEKLCEAVEAATIGTPEELYAELIQVAAMAVKWARQVKR